MFGLLIKEEGVLITEGWIFPDGSEIIAGPNSEDDHVDIVNYFLKGFRTQKFEFSLDLLKEYYFKSMRIDALDDFAVQCLGWIKVKSKPIKIVTYGGYYFQEGFVRKYKFYGCYDDNRDLDGNRFSVVLFECDWNKIIKIGKDM